MDMKTHPLILFIILAFIAWIPVKTYAQDCAEVLQDAQSKYDEGKIHEIPQMLANCLTGTTFTKEERVIAQRLLTLCYLQLNEPELADKSMLGLLNTNPEFQINEAVDPVEFINLYNTFRTDPVMRVGIRGGVSGSIPFIYSKANSESNKDFSGRGYPDMGFQAGPSVEFDLTDKIILNGELFYNQYVYQNKINSDYIKRSFEKLTFSYLSIHALAHYNLINKNLFGKRFTLHGTLGLSNEIMLDMTSELLEASVITRTGTDSKSPIITAKDMFLPINNTAIGGVALSYKIGLPIITIDLRYKYFMLKMLREGHENMHIPEKLTYNILYFNDRWSLQNASVNLGLQIPLYKHEKLTEDDKKK